MTQGLGFKCIIVADDGSQEGERAARMGVGLAASFQAHLVLIGVVEPPNIQAEGSGLPVADPVATRQFMESRFESLLQFGRNLGVRTSLELTEGEAAQEILASARKEDADLIIVGKRHLSRFKRLFEGSTSDEVLREAPCSVLVVQ